MLWSLQKKNNINVFAIITDNDTKIVCGARRADSVDEEKLWQTTCNSHSSNLYVKTLIDYSDSVIIKQVWKVINAFSTPKTEALLIHEGGKKLKNYPDTRFYFFRDTCVSMLQNLDILRKITVAGDIDIDLETENIYNHRRWF